MFPRAGVPTSSIEAHERIRPASPDADDDTMRALPAEREASLEQFGIEIQRQPPVSG